MGVPIRSPAEIDRIRRAGEGARAVLDAAIDACRPGATTRRIDEAGAAACAAMGAESVRGTVGRTDAPPFPGHLCVSVNEEAAHGVPGERILREGDLVTVDVGIRLDGWWADVAEPLVVGGAGARAEALRRAAMRVTEAAMDAAGPGVRWPVVVEAIVGEAGRAGVSLVAGLEGHGVGRSLHEPPTLNFADPDGPGADVVLRPGMVLTIEPTVTDGRGDTVGLDDGWTTVTADRGWACFVERTVAITRAGVVDLTGSAASGAGVPAGAARGGIAPGRGV